MIVVTMAGLIGAFHIGVTTQAQVRAALGPPAKVIRALDEPTGNPIGARLLYGTTTYSFRRGVLADFDTGSPRFRTAAGSRVGMAAARAAELERAKVVPGCSAKLIHVRWDRHHQFALSIQHGRVVGMTYLGPHTTYYEGFC